MSFEAVFDHLTTEHEALLLRQELQAIGDALFSGSDKNLTAVFPPTTRQWVIDVVQPLLHGTATEQQTLLHELAAAVEQLPVLSLTCAIEPSQKLIETLHAFVRQTLGKPVLLSFAYDPGLIGGAIISYNGAYRDYSLLKQVHELPESTWAQFTQQ